MLGMKICTEACAAQQMPYFLASLLQACQREVVKLPVSMLVLSADFETVRMQEMGLPSMLVDTCWSNSSTMPGRFKKPFSPPAERADSILKSFMQWQSC